MLENGGFYMYIMAFLQQKKNIILFFLKKKQIEYMKIGINGHLKCRRNIIEDIGIFIVLKHMKLKIQIVVKTRTIGIIAIGLQQINIKPPFSRHCKTPHLTNDGTYQRSGHFRPLFLYSNGTQPRQCTSEGMICSRSGKYQTPYA